MLRFSTLHPFRLPRTMTELQSFLSWYGTFQAARKEGKWHYGPAFKPIKVAVIDNGIDGNSFGEKLPHGVSFVYSSDEESNWWIASDPHGTQMAKFIRQIDPFCELYVAKVGNRSQDIRTGNVVQV
jgi:hypothetical protein